MLKFIQINIRKLVFTLVYFFGLTFGLAQGKTVWQIMQSGNNSEELSLARGDYKKFLEKDIGWEDGFFVIGHSDIKKDFSYMLPGLWIIGEVNQDF